MHFWTLFSSLLKAEWGVLLNSPFLALVLVNDCHLDVSLVNNSDFESAKIAIS